ncbi:MAG: efflux RND transporter periplasmic adaptor subunit [Magnetococcus sp. DMHC-6]
MEMARKRFFVALLLFLSDICITSCSKEEAVKGGKGSDLVPVTTALVVQKNNPMTLHAMGNAESCHSVGVKSRVDGEIVKVYLADGQEVVQGSLLFDLDDRLYRHRLTQLKANLERDLALLENARAKERRQLVLNKEKFSSEELLTTQVTSRQALEATVAADRGAVAEGELQLSFTHITAPISGMAGRIWMQSGNLVKANDTNPLVEISQWDPICITFTVAEQYLSVIRENQAKAPLELQIFPNHESSQPVEARLLALDNHIDRQTGTVRLKAQARNLEHRLWPGMFLTLTVKLADRPDALLIPAQAVQTGGQGPFVYVVNSDKRVTLRSLTIAQEDKEWVVVREGVSVGEEVVTVGQWRLKPGAQVEIIQATEKVGENHGAL